MLGVCRESIVNWENGILPKRRYVARITSFLGHSPEPVSAPLGERLIAKRRSLGLSRHQAAAMIGVDATSLARWEYREARPAGSRRALVERFLEGP
jgi:ribosome-binding protein aMBF1 (putative translation factor)